MDALREAARLLQQTTVVAWGNVLIGSAPPCVQNAYEKMKNPEVGSWVCEITTAGMRGRDPLDAVGVLEKVAAEKIDFNDPDFVWDEEEEGRPHPTETVYYLRTLDGREFRWSNATLVTILTKRT